MIIKVELQSKERWYEKLNISRSNLWCSSLLYMQIYSFFSLALSCRKSLRSDKINLMPEYEKQTEFTTAVKTDGYHRYFWAKI